MFPEPLPIWKVPEIVNECIYQKQPSYEASTGTTGLGDERADVQIESIPSVRMKTIVYF
jgi:hypothetical protein